MSRKPIDLCPKCYEERTGRKYNERRFVTAFCDCPGCGDLTTIIIYPKRGLWAIRLKNRLLFKVFGNRY